MLDKNSMIADLHIHSRFSRACSRNIDFENLVKWAKIKGLNLLGTGDFTHPVWIEEIKKLKGNGKGFYYYNNFPFVISGEISLMYTQERGRRIHLVLLVPSIEIAEKINSYLDTKGRRDYDGRPIFKISGDEFVREMMNISEEIEIIPAHIWTPWFGVFGSNSGFDSLKECFKEQVEKIHAIETGISSDPEMNWKIKELEDKSIVSFSDAHSFWPFRLGREATIFRETDSYKEIIRQIREDDFLATIETDPAYGKYHWDGHRICSFSCGPEKTKELKGICPKCNRLLVMGVENRVEELASRNLLHEGTHFARTPNNIQKKFIQGAHPKVYTASLRSRRENLKDGREPFQGLLRGPETFLTEMFTRGKKPFYKILPLHEIISLWLGAGMQSKKVWDVYHGLVKLFKNEFNILLNVSREKFLEENVDGKLIGLILRNRNGNIKVKPGYDGEYGVAQIG